MTTEANIPLGCVPIANANGNYPQVNEYNAGTNQTFYQGMLVCKSASGLMYTPSTTRILRGELIGIAAHYKSISSTASGDAIKLYVYDDPNVLFEMQANAKLTNATSWAGYMFPISNLKTGNATTLQSKGSLSVSAALTDISASTAVCVQVVRPVKTIGHTDNLTYSRYICRFVPPYHAYGMATAGIAAASVWDPPGS